MLQAAATREAAVALVGLLVDVFRVAQQFLQAAMEAGAAPTRAHHTRAHESPLVLMVTVLAPLAGHLLRLQGLLHPPRRWKVPAATEEIPRQLSSRHPLCHLRFHVAGRVRSQSPMHQPQFLQYAGPVAFAQQAVLPRAARWRPARGIAGAPV